MVLTPEILLQKGFLKHPSSPVYYLDSMDHTSVAFFSLDQIMITVNRQHISGADLTIEDMEVFYTKITGKPFPLFT